MNVFRYLLFKAAEGSLEDPEITYAKYIGAIDDTQERVLKDTLLDIFYGRYKKEQLREALLKK